jgi:alpha-1,6-mannosyltransferase
MGVDFDAFSGSHDGCALRGKLLRRVGGSEQTALLLYAGRLAKEKNLLVLPPVLAKLSLGSRFDYRLVIAGDGPLRHRMLQGSWDALADAPAELGRRHWMTHVLVQEPDGSSRPLFCPGRTLFCGPY